ncbi:hypothetical protein [Clostridium sp.]|uniref:hypothetical protein n=1 Tax=Clostridium sp. TaxID=1506 RepID=UPI00260C4B4D|nr:hypothetical protein [Clostridium sp.]
MNTKKSIKIYNVVFPIWLLWLFPLTWIVVLPGNFIIDSLVVLITLKLLNISNIKNVYKKTIIKVWLFGFLSDFIGTAIMLMPELIESKAPVAYREWWYKNLTSAVSYNPFKSGYAVAWILMAMIITSFFIYLFNYKISFKKLDMEEKTKKKLALSLAIFTAPYLFLLPTMWFA